MTIANLVANAGGAARRARDTTREMAGPSGQRAPSGWAEPEGADIQITRADGPRPSRRSR